MSHLSELRREDGQTAAEYSVILAVITPAIISALALMSDAIASRLETIAGYFF